MGEGDFVYFSVKESLMCFDTAYGMCVGKYCQLWIEMLLLKQKSSYCQYLAEKYAAP